MDRRKFINRSGLALGTAIITPTLESCATESTSQPLPGTWESVRQQFELDHSKLQMSQMLLASHPKSVREAIQKHRTSFDKDPALYWEHNFMDMEPGVCKAAAEYMGVEPDEVALTDSTTQGLGTLYSGLKLQPGDEILTTTHDHYVTEKALEYAAMKSGATIKRIDEYVTPATITKEEVTSNIAAAITPSTRIVAVTWVQSCTGVKLPIKAIAEVIKDANESRTEDNRIYFCVDGVHGFGNQDENVSDLGCDFFVAGTHKWIFGPRGTGVLWGKKDAWNMVVPTIPAFSMGSYGEWLGMVPEGTPISFSDLMSPGGFHAFDHRWALDEAFKFHMDLGRDKVHQRTTYLNSRLKEGLSSIPGVKLHTPIDPELSAGINCFEVEGQSELDTVKSLLEKGIIASASPYIVSYARLTPCIINTEEEVDRCIEALKELV